MKAEVYTSAFNVIKNDFPFKSAISNWMKVFDRVTVAVNKSEDDTFNQFVALHSQYPDRINVIQTDYSYTDPDMDGKIKNAALQNCTADVVIGLDLDERINVGLKKRFSLYADALMDDGLKDISCIMLPVINIHTDIDHYSDIKTKWYLHKRDGCYRGTVNFAKNRDGTHDVTKSDSCELIAKDGDLVLSKLYPSDLFNYDEPNKLRRVISNNIPYIVHLGYVDLQRRDQLNKNFWDNHWEVEGGQPRNKKSLEDLQNTTIYKHNLTFQF